MLQDRVRLDYSGTVIEGHGVRWVGNISQYIDIWVEVRFRGGGCCFNPFVCGGVLRGRGGGGESELESRVDTFKTISRHELVDTN